MLTRDQILAAPFRFKDIDTPMGVVRVRTMSAAARESFENLCAAGSQTEKGLIRARWIAVCCCDESGSRLFLDEDIPRIAALDISFVGPVFTAALRLNGMGEKAMEDAEKNDEPTHPAVPALVSNAAGSDSQGTADDAGLGRADGLDDSSKDGGSGRDKGSAERC